MTLVITLFKCCYSRSPTLQAKRASMCCCHSHRWLVLNLNLNLCVLWDCPAMPWPGAHTRGVKKVKWQWLGLLGCYKISVPTFSASPDPVSLSLCPCAKKWGHAFRRSFFQCQKRGCLCVCACVPSLQSRFTVFLSSHLV